MMVAQMFMAQIVLCSVIQGQCFMLANERKVLSSQHDCQSEISEIIDQALRELPSYHVHYANCETLPGHSV